MGNTVLNQKKNLILELVQFSDYLQLIDLCNIYNVCRNVPLNLNHIKYKWHYYVFDLIKIEENIMICLFQKMVHDYPPSYIDDLINNENALLMVSKKGYSKTLKLLLQLDTIDVNFSNNERKWSPLWTASRYNNPNCINVLINHPNIDINKKTSFGITALQIACSIGNPKCVKLLLTVPEIDVNIADNEGWTAIGAASWCGHIECVKLLLTHPEININLRNNDGRTPLDCAINNKRKVITELLLNKMRLEDLKI
jgi:ankyrin repeat protein